MLRSTDVLCFGEALIDFFPPAPGQTLVDCDVYHRQLGGAPTNVAVGLARLGVPVGVMTLVGPDDFGLYVRNKLATEGVDVRGVGTHPSAKTGITFVEVAVDGHRRFLFFRHPSADQMIAEDDVDADLVKAARIFHFGSSTLSKQPARDATWKAVAIAKSHGRLISCDPNWRAHLWEDRATARAELQRLTECVDLIKISEEELVEIAGTADVEKGAAEIRRRGATLVLVTLGEKGAYYDAPLGTGWVPGVKVNVVDTTGAGDGFVAGLLAALLPKLSERSLVELSRAELESAVVRGNWVGAQVVTQLGATAGLPRV